LWSWPFAQEGRELKVRPEGTVAANTADISRYMALAGLDLAYLPRGLRQRRHCQSPPDESFARMLNRLSAACTRKALGAIRVFDAFNETNGPYDEHDFGAVNIDMQQVLFKIDHYNLELTTHSADTADPSSPAES
jgi:hypothetical protein